MAIRPLRFDFIMYSDVLLKRPPSKQIKSGLDRELDFIVKPNHIEIILSCLDWSLY